MKAGNRDDSRQPWMGKARTAPDGVVNKVIWFVSHAGGSPAHGPNMRSYYLAQELIKRGWRVCIISASRFHKFWTEPKTRGFLTRETIDGIDYAWVQTTPYRRRGIPQVINQLSFTAALPLALRSPSLPRPDHVVLSSPHPLGIRAVHRAARRLGSTLTFEVRDLWPLVIEDLGNFGPTHPYVSLLRRAEAYAVNHADGIVSVKPGDEEYFVDAYNLPRRMFSYIPNGYAQSAHDDPDTLRTPVDLPEDAFVLGYIGAFSAYYALDPLLAAARILQDQDSDIHIALVGDGDRRPAILQRAASLGLRNVTIPGSIPKAQVPAFLNQCHAAYLGLQDVRANQYGISCNKLFDYMNARLPVVLAVRMPDNYNPILQAECGVVEPSKQPRDIAATVMALRRSPDSRRKAMGDAGAHYLQRHHTFGTITDLYEAHFARLR